MTVFIHNYGMEKVLQMTPEAYCSNSFEDEYAAEVETTFWVKNTECNIKPL